MVRIVCTSDTHNRLDKLNVPDGDILLHAGDATIGGSYQEVIKFNNDLGKLPHKYKIFTPGNHDFLFEQDYYNAVSFVDNAVCLVDDYIEIEGIKIYGAPWQPWYHDWAFNLQRGDQINRKWKIIPEDIDILITHGPPQGILDDTILNGRVGCWDLRHNVLHRIKPRYHIFGHIHEDYGVEEIDNIVFANVSACDIQYMAVNEPFVIDYAF